MANPFLMTEEDSVTPPDMRSNPFLMDDSNADVGGENYLPENPFLAQANNPFADFGGTNDVISSTTEGLDHYPAVTTNELFMSNDHTATMTTNANIQPIDSAMSFFGTTIIESDDIPEPVAQKPAGLNIFYSENMTHLDENIADSSDEELGRDKRGPPPRPVPPSRTTQDLILSVADQMDQTSSHLLGRIPATRTPSPVSIRDLHSPSPTPDVGDLLDVSDGHMNDIDNGYQFDEAPIIENDNPFATVQPTPIVQPAQIIRPEPTRPPPPRPTPPPPPRPTPPRRPPSPSVNTAPITASASDSGPVPDYSAAPASQPDPMQDDLFDMFEAGTKPKKPPPPKSNQDILSLFSAPKSAPAPQAQPDLLSGDILSMDDQPTFNAPIMSDTMFKPNMPAIIPTNPPVPNTTEPITIKAVPNDTAASSMNSTPSVGSMKENVPLAEEIPNATELAQVKFIAPLEKENILDVDVETVEVVSEHSPVEPTIYPENLRAVTPSDQDDSSQYEHMDTTQDYSAVTPTPNPFTSPEADDVPYVAPEVVPVMPAVPPIPVTAASVPIPAPSSVPMNPAIPISAQVNPMPFSQPSIPSIRKQDTFDAFSAKFDSARKDDQTLLDGFAGMGIQEPTGNSAWGESNAFNESVDAVGFGNDEGFDSFLAMNAPPAEPKTLDRNDSRDSDEAKEFNVVIRPKDTDKTLGFAAPILAPPPPPKSSQNNSIYSGDSSPRVNPFDKGDDISVSEELPAYVQSGKIERSDSQETPQTPLFDDDVSQPLEDFPRISYHGDGWEMQLRQPNKKKITGQRFWKKIWLKLAMQGDNAVLQLYNAQKDKDPFQELPLQACYSVSEISAQQYDQFGKIFTIKLQYIFYKERPGVRPGQVTKAERLTTKLSQFAAYAIQGDYQGVKEFGSDLKKLGLPVEHAPQISQLFKIGSHTYEDLKQFSICIEEHLFRYNVHRDRALTYKSEEVQVTAVDELYVEQDAEGHVLKQIARVRLHFLAFLTGMPTIELGVNDLWRQGKEVVGRHDIIPVVTEEWIRLEGVEFHLCVQQNEYEKSRTIRFQPPDACYIELMRFRVRPPKNRELPLQLKATWCVTGNKVELRADILVPGFASRKLGQIPCEDVAIRFPIPECWIYLFRVEKHFRYGSVKSAHRRTGKIKGIERILGTVDQIQESLIEVTSGQAKYEHHHRAIVWRCPRLPKEGQGAYTTHQLVVRMALTSYDQIPEQLAPYCYVEFTMPATQVSHVTVRSISVQDSDSDDPPEKYVRYLARHEYRVGIEHTTGETTNAYLAATTVTKPKEEDPPASLPMIAASDSGSDSD